MDVTLDELTEFFEDLGDSGLCHKDFEAVFAVSKLQLQSSIIRLTLHPFPL